MSTRDSLIAVKSIDRIVKVVGSLDEQLMSKLINLSEKRLIDEYGPDSDDDDCIEQRNDTKEMTDLLIMGNPPPETEPGVWAYLLFDVISLLNLEAGLSLTINKGYKHYQAWGPYRKLVNPHLSNNCDALLKHLENGRPLRGKSVDHDGSMFAWLTHGEITELRKSLAKLSNVEFGTTGLDEFHTDLLTDLTSMEKAGCDLFLVAH